jgi:glycine/D-amino acid oxidase-like deaminating enzyme
VAQLADSANLQLPALKRHLFVLDDIPDLDPGQPFVWSLSENFYFRPESGGLLFSICDEEESTSLEPTVSPDISQSLAELVWRQLPALREATQREVWSCFRTKAPDNSFVIGWDTRWDHLFWVGGLGGHGMGASWEIGRLAAERFLNPRAENKKRVQVLAFEFVSDLGLRISNFPSVFRVQLSAEKWHSFRSTHSSHRGTFLQVRFACSTIRA